MNNASESKYLHSICIQGHLGPILFVCLKFTINLAHAHIMIHKIKYEKTFTGKNSFPCDMNFDNELKLKMVTYLVLLLLECWVLHISCKHVASLWLLLVPLVRATDHSLHSGSCLRLQDTTRSTGPELLPLDYQHSKSFGENYFKHSMIK